MVEIRLETPKDVNAIRGINLLSFGRTEEAALVDALREAGRLTFSLVAELDDEIIGHIAFSPVRIEGRAGEIRALGLGPLAVTPAHQHTGIGTQLMQSGLLICRSQGYGLVFVLGHPDYYHLFGFGAASRAGLRWEHAAPDEAFMVKELVPGALAQVQGVVKYAPEFGAV